MSYIGRNETIDKLFAGSREFFSIPKYQRLYVWKEDNWRQLLEDIDYSNAVNNWNHFIGSFVFQTRKLDKKESDKNDADVELIVVDGQQRLITLELLFYALVLRCYNLLSSCKEEDCNKITYFLSSVKSYIVRKGAIEDKGRISIPYDNTFNKLIKDIIEETPYDEILENLKGVRNSFAYCIEYFYNALSNKNFSQIIQLEKAILKISCIKIETTEESSAFIAFETLNARGLQLRQFELVKNYFFHYLNPQRNTKELVKRWNVVEQSLKDDSLYDDFLYHLFKCCYNKHSIKIKYLYDEIKNQQKRDVDKIGVFFDLVCECSSIYVKVVDCNSGIENIDFYLKYFKVKNNKQCRCIFMALLYQYEKNNLSEKELASIVKDLRNFFVIYNLRGITSNRIDDDIQDLAYNIFNAKEKRPILSAFNKFLIKDRSFFKIEDIGKTIPAMKYSNKGRSSSNESKVFCYLFEMILDNELIDYSYIQDYSKWSIEHIVPDSSENENVQLFGNLLLMDRKTNGIVGSKPYNEKRKIYEKSSYSWISKFAHDYEEFGFESIEKRTEELTKSLRKVLSFNLNDLDSFQNDMLRIDYIEKELGKQVFDYSQAIKILEHNCSLQCLKGKIAYLGYSEEQVDFVNRLISNTESNDCSV